MLNFHRFNQIYLYRPAIDFRKGILGLSVFIQEQLELSPFENALFLFSNRGRDRIKILYWDQTGFAMWYKILEQEKYRWPLHLEGEVLEVNVIIGAAIIVGAGLFTLWRERQQG